MDGMKKCWKLFWVFAQIGITTFGGGYAMLSILQREVVEKRHWATEEELMDDYAIGQCTPGVIAINTATLLATSCTESQAASLLHWELSFLPF